MESTRSLWYEVIRKINALLRQRFRNLFSHLLFLRGFLIKCWRFWHDSISSLFGCWLSDRLWFIYRQRGAFTLHSQVAPSIFLLWNRENWHIFFFYSALTSFPNGWFSLRVSWFNARAYFICNLISIESEFLDQLSKVLKSTLFSGQFFLVHRLFQFFVLLVVIRSIAHSDIHLRRYEYGDVIYFWFYWWYQCACIHHACSVSFWRTSDGPWRIGWLVTGCLALCLLAWLMAALSGCLLLRDSLFSSFLLLLLYPGDFLRLELLVHRRRFFGWGALFFICLYEVLLATRLQILEVSQ